MTRRLLICAAIAVALVLTWLAWEGWLYLQRGYSLSVGSAGGPASIFHIDFPGWRAAVHVLLWIAAMAAIVAYVAGRPWASPLAWLTLSAALVTGIYDVVEYGTIGAPTSIWTVLLVFIFALMTRFRKLAESAET